MADGAPSRTLAWFERQLNSRKAEPVTDDRTTLAMLSEQLADAVATAGAALVAVHARPRLPSTGVHWKDGLVVTTEGTIRREDDIQVTLPDGRHIPATLAGRDRGTDLAVLRIASGSLPVATLGDPATLRPGHLVLALARDRKSTRLNSSHGYISYAVFCLKKKKSRDGASRPPRAQSTL